MVSVNPITTISVIFDCSISRGGYPGFGKGEVVGWGGGWGWGVGGLCSEWQFVTGARPSWGVCMGACPRKLFKV